MSLTPSTRENFIETLCETLRLLCRILQKSTETVTQNFRDALSCHMYMLYSVLFLTEAHMADASGSKKSTESLLQQRNVCSETMLQAATAMSNHTNVLWQRGVADEAVVLIPCRTAYYLLERCVGAQSRKAPWAGYSMGMIAWTIDSEVVSYTPIIASLLDLMHSHEHMSPIVAEICGEHCKSSKLAIELLREYGRLDGSGDAKSNGIKHVAPFICDLANRNPELVLQQLTHLLPHFQADSYIMRNSLVNTLVCVLEYMHSPATSSGTQDEHSQEDSNTHDYSKTRNQILDLLFERVYDTSSFTRSTVLKAWVSLTESKRIPTDRTVPVATVAMDRLKDKSVLVRKQAMQVSPILCISICDCLGGKALTPFKLLTSLLENNPFMGHLDPKPYIEKLGVLYKTIEEKLPLDIAEAQDEALKSIGDDPDKDAVRDVKQATLAAVLNEVKEWNDLELSAEQREYKCVVEALTFAQSALDFIGVFEESKDILESMILSANTSDVTEALRFFVRARHFQLPCAESGIKRSLALMWASEQSIREEVLKAFVDIFIAEPGSEGKVPLPESRIAKNLLAVTAGASISDLASIEEAIMMLVKQERIPGGVFSILWSVVATSDDADIRATALQLISMAAGSDQSVVDSKSRLRTLLDAALGEYAESRKNWKLVAAASAALQKIRRPKADNADAKFLVVERIELQLQAVACGDWCVDENTEDTERWFSASEQALKAIFVISQEPENCCAEIIRGMYETTFKRDGTSIHHLRLARFFHVVGQVALSLLVYTENLVGAVRRANSKKTVQKQEEAAKAGISGSVSNGEEEDAIETELGIAAEQDAANERKMADISENEILGHGLIGTFIPLLVSVVSNESGQFNALVLRQASSLALCKLMCISGQFCEKYLPLLFTVLKQSPSTALNIVLALGDLAFRYPNQVEPYTPLIYALLRENSSKVRRHTMMVLTHLILNDMVKVKGNVAEIALCLRDKDPRIRDMSRLLFNELSKRSNNPVYNLLPDIVSQISQMPNRTEDFREIMQFLLGFIQKDRMNELLCEKFLQRFEKCNSISQKADIAYCLSLLKVTDRSVKHLSDNFKAYKDTLFEADIQRSFMGIVSKAKKTLKQEVRPFLEEWEDKLNEVAANAVANETVQARANEKRRRKTRKTKVLNAIPENCVREED